MSLGLHLPYYAKMRLEYPIGLSLTYSTRNDRSEKILVYFKIVDLGIWRLIFFMKIENFRLLNSVSFDHLFL